MSRPLRILVVEDHPDSRTIFLLYLETLGHEVLGVSSAAEAMRVLPSAPWDLLISDIGLPDGTGWELLRAVHAVRPLPAIAMSGFGSADDLERSRKAGFTRHLVKPVELEVIEAALAEIAAGLA